MGSTTSFNITLPPEMAEMVKSKVASGEYATESDVIRDGLETLAARDATVERWLIKEVVPAFDAHKENPGRAIGLADAMARIKAKSRSR
jgi:putative addiction module CopG family antidote